MRKGNAALEGIVHQLTDGYRKEISADDVASLAGQSGFCEEWLVQKKKKNATEAHYA